MGLVSFLRRLRKRPPSGIRVELKPLEQVVLAHLIRSGGAGDTAVQGAIDERRPALPRSARDVMAPLLEQGLAEARLRPDAETSEAVYVPTAKGMRLKNRLPQNPTTVTDFWI
jgi:hypothetical protein